MAQTNTQTHKQTDRRTSRLYDWIGPVGPIQWKQEREKNCEAGGINRLIDKEKKGVSKEKSGKVREVKTSKEIYLKCAVSGRSK